jgi:hypothetical protein
MLPVSDMATSPATLEGVPKGVIFEIAENQRFCRPMRAIYRCNPVGLIFG